MKYKLLVKSLAASMAANGIVAFGTSEAAYQAEVQTTCEACTALAAGAQRVTKPHSDECREHMDELVQRDEDALVSARRQAPKRLDGCRSEWR